MQHIGSVYSSAQAEQSNSRQYHSLEQNCRVQQVATDRLSVDWKVNVPTSAIFFPEESDLADLEKPAASRIELMLHNAVLLRRAIISCDIQQIFALINSGANVKIRTEHGRTALHNAVKFNVLMAIIILIKHGADFNTKDNQGYTPLHIAAALGNTDAVKMLIQHGADRNIKDNQGCTPLDISRKKDHINIINILLSSSNFSEGTSRPIQKSFILKRHQIQRIEPLNRSTRIELPNTQIQKPVKNLHRYQVTRPAAFDFSNNTKPVENLSKRGSYNKLKRIVKYADLQEINTLLRRVYKKKNDSSRGYSKDPLLHDAAESGRIEVAKLLIEYGANVNGKSQGTTHLGIALYSEKYEMAKELLVSGANINTPGMYDDTPLHLLVKRGAPNDLVEFFLEKGADLEARNLSNQTPLECAKPLHYNRFKQLLEASNIENRNDSAGKKRPASLALTEPTSLKKVKK